MGEPTKAQVKEFWEWCGLDLKGYHCDGDGQFVKYIGSNRWIWHLPIDLNNLFKWAVPKVNSSGYYVNLSQTIYKIDGWHCKVWADDAEIYGKSKHSDPALALFWAIWEVIHGQD